MNAAGLALIKEFEGCELRAYRDVAGIWTIGYGHTLGVKQGDVWSQEQADQALAADLASTEEIVARLSSPAAENQHAAMMSLAYNIGVVNFRNSSVLRQHKAGNFATAADDFRLWNKARIRGRLTVVDGLTRRREAERALYLTLDSPPMPAVS